jgi:hypothetical protein
MEMKLSICQFLNEYSCTTQKLKVSLIETEQGKNQDSLSFFVGNFNAMTSPTNTQIDAQIDK